MTSSPTPKFKRSIVWFRRDLRVFDHAALSMALEQSAAVFCIFVFDKTILDALPRCDRRVEFIHASLVELDAALRELGGTLIVKHAVAADEIPRLAAELEAEAVFANRDYEPQAIRRDAEVALALERDGRWYMDFKDQVIFEKHEVLTLAGQTFSVFTPYKNAWLKRLAASVDSGIESPLWPYQTEEIASRLAAPITARLPSLAEIGFEKTDLEQLKIPAGMAGAQSLLDAFLPRIGGYDTSRNFPALASTSSLSVHLRFGTVSIRGLARLAYDIMRAEPESGAAVWLSELIWRDFYFMILHAHPHVTERAFKPAFDDVEWESGKQAEQDFAAWCQGQTGYPLVDAAMVQLNQTGFMHNRLRMVSASFLIKDLGIDWRRGERYFAEKLIDYDLAANNGGWQWAASSGCDAQPWFRVFNPVTQSERFDPDGKFIKTFLPRLRKLPPKLVHAPWLGSSSELEAAGITLGTTYPAPLVRHDEARKQTLARYGVVRKTEEMH
ncbi:deoxyribodipyrimidine photo-lyase [soil metagenome]